MTTGFGFGAKSTAAPTFGTGSLTFGTPASQPSQQFGFGSLSSSTPNLFGTQTTTTTSALGFKPTGFGTPSTNPGFTLGATNLTTAATTGTPGFSFGTPAASTGLTFGTPASTSAGFKPPASGGLTFGTPATTGLSFGTPATTAGLNFGTTTSAPGTGLSFGAPASTPSTGLSFGATTTSTPNLGLSFGTATTAPSLSFGGLTTTTSATGFTLGLGGTTTTTTTQQNVGLGGIAFTQAKTGTSTAQKELPPKEQPLPNEFSQLVEQFKNVVQEEKNRSSEVARCSVKEYRKVETELDSLNQQFNQIETQLINSRNLAEELKYETAKGLQNIEMAQRTQETPPSLQYDNTAPLQFFLGLADNFERELQLLKSRIFAAVQFVKKCNEPNVLTSQDLASGLKRLHETFVALAGRMQSIHTQVEAQKELFLNLRKQVINDNVNPFEKASKIESMNQLLKIVLKAPPTLASGPTPFNSIALGSNNLTLAAQQTSSPFQIPPTTTSSGFGFGSTAPTFGSSASNTSMFKTGFGASPFQLNTTSNFQLQKPPTGNKRGKQ